MIEKTAKSRANKGNGETDGDNYLFHIRCILLILTWG